MNKRSVDILDMSGMLEFDPRRLRKFVRALDSDLPAHLRAPDGDLSVALFDDARIAKIHADFMNIPTATDVITFDGEFAGEICASAETAFARAGDFDNTPSRELCLYVAHGYLHLAGVDDVSDEDALKMRAAEAEAMKILDAHFRKPIFKFISQPKK